VKKLKQLTDTDHAKGVLELLEDFPLIRSAADSLDEAEPRLRSIALSCTKLISIENKMKSLKNSRRYLQVLRFFWIPIVIAVTWFGNIWFGIALSAVAFICVGISNLIINYGGKQIEEYEDIGARVSMFHELAEKLLDMTNHELWLNVSDALKYADDLCGRILIVEDGNLTDHKGGELGETFYVGDGYHKQKRFYPLRVMRSDLRGLVDTLKRLGADPDDGNLQAKYDRARAQLVSSKIPAK